MNTDEHKYPNKDETFAVIGSAMEVHNYLGHGLKEKVYENSITVEFKQRGIPYQQQPRYPVTYKNQHVGEFIPDLIAFSNIIIDTKVISKITDLERGQMLNYLKITKIKVGLIINFKQPKLEYVRVVL